MNVRKRRIIMIFFNIGVIVIVIALIFLNRLSRERLIIDEQKKINETSEVDENIKSKGELKLVEKAMKDYYQEYFSYKEIVNNTRADSLANILTPEYLNENRNKLKDIKEEFNEQNELFKENINLMISMLDEKKILSYLDKNKVSKHNYNFYKSIMISEEDKEIVNELNEFITNNDSKYEALSDLIDLLIKENKYWYVVDDKLYMDKKEDLEKYNDLRIRIFNLDREQEV